jgi:hypothetical protein
MENMDNINSNISSLFATLFAEYFKNMDEENKNEEHRNTVINIVSFVSVSLIKSENGINNVKLLKTLLSMNDEEIRIAFEKADNFFEEIGPNMGILLVPCVLMHENNELIQLISSGFDINPNDIKTIVNSLVNKIFNLDNISNQKGGISFSQLVHFAKIGFIIMFIFGTIYVDYLYINNILDVTQKISTSMSATLINGIFTYMMSDTPKNCQVHSTTEPHWEKVIAIFSKMYNITMPQQIQTQLNCLKANDVDTVYAYLNLNMTMNANVTQKNKFEVFSNELTLLNTDKFIVPVSEKEKTKLNNLNAKLQEKYSQFQKIEDYEKYLKEISIKPIDDYIAELNNYALTPPGYEFSKDEDEKKEETVIARQPTLIDKIKNSEIWQRATGRYELTVALLSAVSNDAISLATNTGRTASITPWESYLRAIRDYQMEQLFQFKTKKLEVEYTLQKIYTEMQDFIKDATDAWYYFWIISSWNAIIATFIINILIRYFDLKKEGMAQIESKVLGDEALITQGYENMNKALTYQMSEAKSTLENKAKSAVESGKLALKELEESGNLAVESLKTKYALRSAKQPIKETPKENKGGSKTKKRRINRRTRRILKKKTNKKQTHRRNKKRVRKTKTK